MIASIPPEAILAITDRELPHASNREHCWNLSVDYHGSDYIIYTTSHPIPTEVTQYQAALRAGYVKVMEKPGLVLLRRPDLGQARDWRPPFRNPPKRDESRNRIWLGKQVSGRRSRPPINQRRRLRGAGTNNEPSTTPVDRSAAPPRGDLPAEQDPGPALVAWGGPREGRRSPFREASLASAYPGFVASSRQLLLRSAIALYTRRTSLLPFTRTGSSGTTATSWRTRS